MFRSLAPGAVTKLLADANHLLREQPKALGRELLATLRGPAVNRARGLRIVGRAKLSRADLRPSEAENACIAQPFFGTMRLFASSPL